MKRVLIIEDDTEVSDLLQTLLGEIYDVVPAYSGTEGLLLLDIKKFDIILLDMMLPGMSGSEILKIMRKKINTPVIILTAINDKKLISETLLDGADDYLTKPFDVDELLARISVQLRKNTQAVPNEVDIMSYKEIKLNLTTFQIQRKDQKIDLSKKEVEILKLLVQHPNKVYTKDDIYKLVWGEMYFGDENTINVHISNLRKKIAKLDARNTYIDTIWGIGIKLAE